MSKREYIVSNKTCFLFQDSKATHLLIQPVDEHDLEVLDQEVEAVRNLTKAPFSLVALLITDWNQELTPWAAPPVFGKIPFGAGANRTLAFISKLLLPNLSVNGLYDNTRMRLLLGGYSLAGLFSLWASYQSELFDGVVAASPSVWFPRWIEFATENNPLASSVYLSLGDKEEKAKNPVMARVGNVIRKQEEMLKEQGVDTILEWNAGNHFVDSEKRMAKGFAWLMNNMIMHQK